MAVERLAFPSPLRRRIGRDLRDEAFLVQLIEGAVKPSHRVGPVEVPGNLLIDRDAIRFLSSLRTAIRIASSRRVIRSIRLPILIVFQYLCEADGETVTVLISPIILRRLDAAGIAATRI